MINTVNTYTAITANDAYKRSWRSMVHILLQSFQQPHCSKKYEGKAKADGEGWMFFYS